MRRLIIAAALNLGVASSAFGIGAIAVDDAVNLATPAYGFAIGAPSRAVAEERALQYCRQYGTNCRAVVWFQTCGAYAASQRFYGYGWGATKAHATAQALKMCGQNSCEVVVAKCE